MVPPTDAQAAAAAAPWGRPAAASLAPPGWRPGAPPAAAGAQS